MVKSAALYTSSRETLKKGAATLLLASGLLSVNVSCVTEKAAANDLIEVEPSSNAHLPARVESPPVSDKPSQPTEARAAVALSEKEQFVLRKLFVDDFRGYTEGSDTIFGRGADASEYVIVNADGLQDQYERNEVAGDKKFRGKRLILSGKVASIDRSIGESYFVSLKVGTNQSVRPRAMMADGHTDYLAELEKGQTIRLVCKGDGLLMGSAIASGCVPAASWVEQMTALKMRELPELIRAKDKSVLSLLVITVGMTAMLPETSACWSAAPMAPNDLCSNEFSLLVDQLQGKIDSDKEFEKRLLSRVKAILE